MKKFKLADEELAAKVEKQNGKIFVKYHIEDIEEPISKKMLLYMKKVLGGDFTLITNAGVELHSREVKNNTWKGIKVQRENKMKKEELIKEIRTIVKEEISKLNEVESYDSMMNKLTAVRDKGIKTIKKIIPVPFKQSGFMADNIWVADFKTKEDYATAIKSVSNKLPKNVIEMKKYDKPLRLVFMF